MFAAFHGRVQGRAYPATALDHHHLPALQEVDLQLTDAGFSTAVTEISAERYVQGGNVGVQAFEDFVDSFNDRFAGSRRKRYVVCLYVYLHV